MDIYGFAYLKGQTRSSPMCMEQWQSLRETISLQSEENRNNTNYIFISGWTENRSESQTEMEKCQKVLKYIIFV